MCLHHFFFYSSGDYDFEFQPNPHRVDVAAQEDQEADMEWQQGANELENEIRNLSDESIPDSSDSMWNLEEDDDDLMLLNASQMIEQDYLTPIVRPPAEIAPEARPPKACITCLDSVATVVSTSCGHALVCRDCRPHFNFENCSRCNARIENLIEVILT